MMIEDRRPPENDLGQYVLVCGYCGNKTIHDVRGYYFHPKHLLVWHLLQCSSCAKPSLLQNGGEGAMLTDEVKREILYPYPKPPLPDLPEAIDKAYTAALKVRNIEPNACAVLVGRTLEVVCNHEHVAGRSLAEKLDDLARSGRIPLQLAQMAHQIRQIRNFGAHAAADEVTEEDIPIILDFVEAILEYLYVAPAKIAAVQRRISKRP